MKVVEAKTSSRRRAIFVAIIYFIVTIMYSVSIIFVGCGVALSVYILLFGNINIENGQIVALGILMYFPLRYCKKRLDKEDIAIFKRHKA